MREARAREDVVQLRVAYDVVTRRTLTGQEN